MMQSTGNVGLLGSSIHCEPSVLRIYSFVYVQDIYTHFVGVRTRNKKLTYVGQASDDDGDGPCPPQRLTAGGGRRARATPQFSTSASSNPTELFVVSRPATKALAGVLCGGACMPVR